MNQFNSNATITRVSVMKFGGSSFTAAAGFAAVCEWIDAQLAARGTAHRIVCVVSAPTGATERHRETLLALNTAPSDRLIDAALPLADSLGAAQVAAALQARGVAATVALGSQIGLRTDTRYARARLQSVDTTPLQQLFTTHTVVVVPGGGAAVGGAGTRPTAMPLRRSSGAMLPCEVASPKARTLPSARSIQ